MLHFIIIALIIIGLFTGVGCKVNTNKTKVENIYKPNDTIPQMYSKKDIEILLKNLAKSEPKDLKEMGAMCYSPVPIYRSADYICPVCGEKTIYTNYYASLIERELPYMRTMANFKNMDIKLDESQFCKKCSPQIEEPKLCLIVKYEAEAEHITCDISRNDLKILNEFFGGSVVHKTFNDAEQPLKDYLVRIEELLGVKIEN